ncbi:MAG: helix-turn-helix domain-containing protein [Gemmatimonadota bacterium]
MTPANQEGRIAVLDAFPPAAAAVPGAALAGDAGPAAGGPAARQRQGAAVWLGAELRRLRREAGISQRKLTQLIGLSAHSNLGEYERGDRIPPGDIVRACERLLTVPPGYLQRLHQQALRERARAGGWAGVSLPGHGG